MIETLNSVESLETLLKELEPELPLCVYFLGPLLGSKTRCSQDVCNPKTPPPNPIRNHPYSGLVGFSPLLVMVELFRPIQGRIGGWLYTIHFVLDQLLTTEEVRTKVHAAAVILAAQRGETCAWETYVKELDEMEREGFPDEPVAN